MRFYYDGNKNRQTHIKRECFTWNILFATQISISSCKADIHNPSLQLCWQGLASLLAHERSRFAICQLELSTPTDRSIPLIRRLVLRALEAGECLFAFKKGQSLTTDPHLVRQTLKSFDYPLISSTRPSTPYFVCFFLRWSKRIFAIHPCSSADRA